ncbi:MAG: UbiA family prenyltransferase [Candidatus Nitrosopumilus sp. bin_6a]
MFKDYLQLVRIPGIFTAFSNVLIGHFSPLSITEVISFPFLLLTSGMLFCSGMIFNDYFDLKIDKKERPNRPLPSGKIPKQNALFLGIIFVILANFFAFVVGYYSLVISLIMTAVIISYNYKLKFISFLGIINLSLIRFLNVLLGFSIISISFEIIQYAIPIGILVGGISILARNEVDSTTHISKKLNKIFILITIGYVFLLIINNFQITSLIFLGLFSAISLYVSYEKRVQKQITFQLLSIILLDATIISTFTSFHTPILISLLIIPAYFITKKLYLT